MCDLKCKESKTTISLLSKHFINNFKTKNKKQKTKMKRELIFMFACIVSVATTFISCTGDEFEDAYTQEEPQKTRAVRTGMTMEEVQARLDEIGTKYGTNINLLYVKDYSEVTESTFEQIERQIIKERNSTNINKTSIRDNVLINDNIIDEYDIATLNSEIEEDKRYDAELDFCIEFKKNSNEIYYYTLKYNMGLNFVTVSDRTSVNAEFNDYSHNIVPFNYFVGFFYHNVVHNDNNTIYFPFEFAIEIEYLKNFFIKRVYGIYHNGFELIYSTGSGLIKISI